jgi:O-antigen ligase/tetratricopeptide (TPR) repeat protein
MQNQQIEKILRYIIVICLYLVVFAPLILHANYFFPAIFPKAVYIRILVEIMLIAYIPLAILSPKFRPRFNLIYVSILVFALVVIITSIFGENFSYSMWGNYERMDGIFSWSHYWILIVIAASVLTEKKDWMKFFSVSIISAVLMAFYGFLQRAGVDSILMWTIYETNLGRITSTIGNPAFFAVYLFFNITFAFVVVVNKHIADWWRIIVGITLIPLFVAYFMTGVKGAAMALLFGIILFVVGYVLWSENKKIKKIVLYLFAGFFIFMSLLFVFKESSFATKNAFFGRLFTMSISDPTIQTRLISWGIECENGFGSCGALKGIKENFFLGVGPQKFDIVFNKYFDPRFYALVGTETWWDRAHNMVLEVFATMGVVGLLAYLGVGLSMVYSLYRIGKKEKGARVEILILLAFLGGYFIQNLFVFDTISSYIVLTVFVSYIVSRTTDFNFWRDRFEGFLVKIRNTISQSSKEKIPQYWWVGLITGLIIIAPITYHHNIKLLDHNRKFLLNVAFGAQKPMNQTLDSYKEIVEISDFDNREVAIKLGQYMGQLALSKQMTVGELQNAYRFVIRTMEESVEKNPKDVRLFISYGNALNVYGELIRNFNIEESNKILKVAENILTEAVELGSSRQQVYYSLANTFLIQQKNDKGVSILEDAVRLNEGTPTAHWILAIAYKRAGNKEKAIQSADMAVEKGYTFVSENEVAQIASLYTEGDNLEGLLLIYQKMAKDLKTGTAQAKVSATLAQMGKKEEAIEEARKVIQLDPSLRDDVLDFIKQVESGEEYNFMN